MNNSILLSLDMEKALDRVDHKYLFNIIDRLKLGEFITHLIKLIYQNIHQIIETPKGQIDKLMITRGIRQGFSYKYDIIYNIYRTSSPDNKQYNNGIGI
jgi:hypothetical protein